MRDPPKFFKIKMFQDSTLGSTWVCFFLNIWKPFWEFIEFGRIPSFWDTPNVMENFLNLWGLDQHLNYYKVTIASYLVRNGCPLFASNDVPWMIGWLDGWMVGWLEVGWIFCGNYQKDTLDVSLAESSVSLRICLVKLDLEEASTNFLVLVQCWWQWLLLLDDVSRPLQTLSQARVELVARLA